MKALACCLLLFIAVPVMAADDNAGKWTNAVSPHLEDETAGVIRINLKKLDLNKIYAQLSERAGKPARNLGFSYERLGRVLDAFRKTGVEELYICVSPAGMPLDMRTGDLAGLLYFLMPQTADAEALRKIFPASFIHERLGDMHFFGTKQARKRLAESSPKPRPELAEAFRAAGDGAIQIAVTPSANQRRVIEELNPNLPAALGSGSIEPVARGIRWAAVGLDQDPALKVQIVVQGRSANDAQKVGRIMNGLVAMLPLTGFVQDAVPVPRFPQATITIDRIELVVDNELLQVGAAAAARLQEQMITSASMQQLKRVAIAMHNYLDTHGALPATANFDKSGKPLLSWRVLILPFLGQEALYKQFHLDEPWNSEHNKQLIDKMPAVYRFPSDPAGRGLTRYVSPVGKGYFMSGEAKGRKITDITDGTSNTMMILEVPVQEATIWTKPDDWTYDAGSKTVPGEGKLRGFTAAFADGSAHYFSTRMKPEVFHALLTIAGGEVVPSNEIHAR